MTKLYLYLNGVWMIQPFVWGKFDCVLAVCDWVTRNGWDNPGQEFIGKYTNRIECDTLTGLQSNPKSFVDLLDKGCSQVGLARTATVVKGDVGVLRVDDMLVGGIKLGNDFWAFKGEEGVTIAEPDSMLTAWGVGYVD